MSGILELLKKLGGMGTKCVYCQREIPEQTQLCATCVQSEHKLIPEDSQSDGIFHVFCYEGVVRKLIHNLKYNDMPRLSMFIAQRMQACYTEHNLQADLITYVPIHTRRMQQRGFDQCELIASHLGTYLHLPVQQLLVRQKNTHPQFELSREERLHNMKNAFARQGHTNLTGKRILLIDDIYTTGSTMSECTACLNEATVLPFVFSKEY